MKVIIIGGVAAGMSVAAKLKRLKKDTDIIVFDRGDEISLGACGLPFFVGGDVKDSSNLISRSANKFRETGIDVREFTEITAVNTNEKTVTALELPSGREYTEHYDKLVVATGAAPRLFPPLDVTAKNLFTVRTIKGVTPIKELLQSGKAKAVLIVGGGFIGVEMAEACRKYPNVKVTLLQRDANILNQFDSEFSQELTQELEANGVNIYTNADIKGLNIENSEITGAVVAISGETTKIIADIVINATGVKPETDFINGVDKLSNGAIIVNKNMQTSIKDIYAGGDCSAMKSFITGEYTYTPLGTNANKQGRVIASHIAGEDSISFKLIGSAVIRVFGKDAGTIGLTQQQAEKLGIKHKTHTIIDNDIAGYMSSQQIKIKIVYNPDNLKILGAQLIGRGVVAHRANYFAIAITAGVTTKELGSIDLAYAPPFSGVWDPVLIAGNTAK